MQEPYTLPKTYLSWSAINLWLKNKEQYRNHYYRDNVWTGNTETRYGSKIATAIETNDPEYLWIPRFEMREYEFRQDIDGVTILAKIDTFDPQSLQFGDHKTGKIAWTQNKVYKHRQLDLYSLAIEAKHGSVDDKCFLWYLPTQNKTETITKVMDFGDKKFEATQDVHSVVLTGEVITFERIVTKNDRELMRRLIVSVASEISSDYRAFLGLSNPSQVPPTPIG